MQFKTQLDKEIQVQTLIVEIASIESRIKNLELDKLRLKKALMEKDESIKNEQQLLVEKRKSLEEAQNSTVG